MYYTVSQIHFILEKVSYFFRANSAHQVLSEAQTSSSEKPQENAGSPLSVACLAK